MIMDNQQMIFTGEAGCPTFCPNAFKADICSTCQNKIQSHSSATEKQISAALEFSVDSVPSLIWVNENSEGKLYLGGYKAAVNVSWLKKSNISLIVNTAKGLEQVLGPKYIQKVDKRNSECPEIDIYNYLISDDIQQKVEIEDLKSIYQEVKKYLDKGSSVLVHCAQGKSRSTTVMAAVLCFMTGQPVHEIVQFIKSKRSMADPNVNFCKQLKDFERNGDFKL